MLCGYVSGTQNYLISRIFRRYYKKQDELITAFEGVNNMAYSDGDNSEAAKRLRKKAAILAKISFFMNLVSGSNISDFCFV